MDEKISINDRSLFDVRNDHVVEPFLRRVESTPPGSCPLSLQLAFLESCQAQTCGKCTPCSEGIPKLASLLRKVVAFEAHPPMIEEIQALAELLWNTADCAVGYQAGKMILDGLDAFSEEYESHIQNGCCSQGVKQTVPCVTLCPAHVNVPAYIALAHEERFDAAIKVIRNANPFPTACALVCEHPCEAHCRRTIIDAPLNIRGIKKFIVDNAAASTVDHPQRAQSTGKRIAVVGGGPSGLTCAYFSALMGHDVVVYEGRKQLGGMMRYGIPSYRLPREQLDEDIRAILNVGGITVNYESPVNKDTMKTIAEEFDAVYIAIGAQVGKDLSIEGSDAEGVMSAVELLSAIGDEIYPDFTGKKVVVIGGGNVAMDCARTSLRAGAKEVTVAYRRRLEDMTALPEEVEAALAEGVEMMCLQSPVRIEANESNHVRALICQPQYIGAVKHGRPAPVAAAKPEISLEADVILVAIGQDIVSEPFEEFGMEVNRSCFVANEYLEATGQNNVFVGGDCHTGPKTVIMAIAAGKAAARNIDLFLGFSHKVDPEVAIPPARLNNRTAYGRVNITERPARIRKHDFYGVEERLGKQEALQECSRCLRCDVFGIGALTGRGFETW